VGAQFYFKSPQPPAENKPATSAPAANSSAAAPLANPVAAPGPQSKSKAGQNVEVATKQAASESETVIENGLYKITFSNRGGQVKSWILKKYTDDKGQPLELVHPIARAGIWIPTFALHLRPGAE